ncbi:unnamed protein product [Pleuronectes platessa]|uniref:Uncharacterized protein n=1 Tax=Pleuronectes platessa TaxID=8262 RepID=A0A9N7TWS4_PLEPL|nr:unnamed protein product [Pleuronectes platessa]
MKELSAQLFFLSFSRVCFFWTLLTGSRAQDAAGDDALRRGLTWQHNGQVFSLLSRGAQYRPSSRRQTGSPGRGGPVVVVSTRNETGVSSAAQPRSSPRVPASSGTAQLRTMLSRRPQQQPADGDAAPGRREDMMVGDDPYNPYKASNYYPYYNYYNSYYRPRARAHQRHGYGTSFHQHGTTPRPCPHSALHEADV